MRLQIVEVYDSVAEMFMPPQFERALGAAIRSFEQGVLNTPHANDLILYHAGEYDDVSGEYSIFESKRKLSTGFDVTKLHAVGD